MISEGPIVCFGEVLVRLTAPDNELLLQSGRLSVNFGGAETNVAVSLSRLGGASRMASVLPDNAIGRAAFDALRGHGVDVSRLRFVPGRMGLYFLTPGAVRRPSEVIYDRWGSVFAEAEPDAIDWQAMLQGAAALHMSGITPALGPKAAAAALRAAKAANGLGVPVSFDGNYRGKLWALWNGDGPKILRELLACASVAFVDDRDIALVLGQTFGGPDAERQRQAADAAFEAFPTLQRIATTRRVQPSMDHHELSASMSTREGREWVSEAETLTGIVDRIGAGDAFAAGLLHGLRRGFDDQTALDFAKAAACLKHGIPGDFNLASEADVKALLAQEGLDIRR
ncbi:MAG TPA: sugar kinase [Rhizomicrobium sp.]|nr:sugar kinase [Rhizomicrobium sp.]